MLCCKTREPIACQTPTLNSVQASCDKHDPQERREEKTRDARGEIVGPGTKPFVSKMLLTLSLPIGHRKTPLTKCFPFAYMLLYYFLRVFQLCWNSKAK